MATQYTVAQAAIQFFWWYDAIRGGKATIDAAVRKTGQNPHVMVAYWERELRRAAARAQRGE